MVRKPNPSSKTLVATFVAAAFGLTAGAAFAQTTTSHNASDEAAANSGSARHVTLSRNQSEQTLQYSRARDLRICNLTGQPTSAAESVNAAEDRAPQTRSNLAAEAPKVAPNPVALEVSYEGKSEQVQPGNCYEFQAQNVHLSSVETLPPDSVLNVSIAQMSGNDFVNGRTEAAASEHEGSSEHERSNQVASKKSIEELKEQLKQEDEQEQQANAELSAARAKLAQTTRDLKEAQSREEHVASTERHTAKTAREAQQRAENAQPAEPKSSEQSSSSSNSETPE